MKILFVAMSESVHTARWISQVSNLGWEIHLFPSIDYGRINPSLENIHVYHTFYPSQNRNSKNVISHGFPVFNFLLSALGRRGIAHFFPNYRSKQLANIIDSIKPDIVHSLEMQNAGYLVLNAKNNYLKFMPPWIVTNWGSDIFLFGRLNEHKQKIKDVLFHCNYYSCECIRDVYLAKDMGFNGVVLPVFPNTGGFDLAEASFFRNKTLPSKRRCIMLKGYQNWAGRALVGLRALERCVDILSGYEILLFSASTDVKLAAELFNEKNNISINILPNNLNQNEILHYHSISRISIGLSISDAISTSLLEAIVMGSFPIQSFTACADEWVINEKSGLLVPPEDVDVIEKAIRVALNDDKLVDEAFEINWQTAINRLDHENLKSQTISFYKKINKK